MSERPVDPLREGSGVLQVGKETAIFVQCVCLSASNHSPIYHPKFSGRKTEGLPHIPLPTNTLALVLGDPEAFLRQMGHVISLASSFRPLRNLPQGEHVQDISRGSHLGGAAVGYPRHLLS